MLYYKEVKAIAETLGVSSTVIQGEDLRLQGFGGIYGVGKAAVVPPALAVLSHTPEGATQTVAWVGKGIVYDTGGLSIKAKVRHFCRLCEQFSYSYFPQYMKLLTILNLMYRQQCQE